MLPVDIQPRPVTSTGSTPASTPPKSPKYIYNAALDTFLVEEDVYLGRAKEVVKGFIAGLDAMLAPKDKP